MFKHKKIGRFIDRYSKFLSHDEDELKEILYGVKKIENVIYKIDKLPDDRKEYVFKTLNDYKKYGFNGRQIELIMNNKIEIGNLMRICSEDLPDYDKLFFALNNEKLYTECVADLEKKYNRNAEQNISIYSLSGYIDTIIKHYEKVHEIFGKCCEKNKMKKKLTSLYPTYLRRLLDYDTETLEEKKVFLNYLSSSDSDFNRLSSDEFDSVLNFVLKNEGEDKNKAIKTKLKILENEEVFLKNPYTIDKYYLEALESLPFNYLYGIYGQRGKPNNKSDERFIELVRDSNFKTRNMLLKFINETNSKYDDILYTTITSKRFYDLEDDTKEKLLKELSNIANKENNNSIVIKRAHKYDEYLKSDEYCDYQEQNNSKCKIEKTKKLLKRTRQN